jgi:hypothetical protein
MVHAFLCLLCTEFLATLTVTNEPLGKKVWPVELPLLHTGEVT